MNFETLKKSHKKQIVIGALVICVIGGALTFATTRAKYKLTEDLELAKGTVNYKPYDFKIMAIYKSDDKTNYTEINEMPSSGYTLNESKSYCNMSDGTKDTTALLKTIDGNHAIGKLKKNDRCYLYFDKEPTASETILGNVTIKTGTPTFSNIATTDEGVYKIEDGMYGGYSYYWRGAVTNNYVKFGGFCWRIIRINGDGSLRLIYDGATCHANGTNTAESIAKANVAYNTSYNQSNYVGWTYTGTSQRTLSGTSSNAKTQLESWYNSNLASHAGKIADGKYCNDRNAGNGTWSSTGATFYYAPYTRIITNKSPSLSCLKEDTYILKIGALTVDEAMYAGGLNKNNKQYYLYNGQNYWTMSPAYWNGSESWNYYIYTDGDLNSAYVNILTIGLRPVINLKSDITFSDGNGTQSNPYIVS